MCSRAIRRPPPAWLAVRAGVVLFALAAAPAGAGVRVLGDGLQLSCADPEPTRIACDYRLVSPAPVIGAAARAGRVALPTPVVAPYLDPPTSSAVLILVDTSDPARAPALRKQIAHIVALLEAAEPWHRLGLAAFDRDLRVLAPIGAEPDRLREAAAGLRAEGLTTELYRNALEAVKLLEAAPAERRGLVLMSDGLAEDRAYFHEDVVRAARDAGVVIYGLGYPRSVALSVGLQSLRRLAEETGGAYVATGPDFELPEAFFSDPFAVLDNGGRVTVRIPPEARAALPPEPALELELKVPYGRVRAALPLALPPVPTAPQTTPVRPETIAAAGPAATRSQAPERRETPADSGIPAVLIPVALLALAGAGLWLTLRFRRRRPDLAATDEYAPPLAWFEPADGSGRRHPVTRPSFRIGRHADNDLMLDDPSVSREHAELHRDRDGRFSLIDLDSMNGVFVNQRKVDQIVLADGDLLEIGDRAFRFRVRARPAPAAEITLALKTARPKSPLPDLVPPPAARKRKQSA